MRRQEVDAGQRAESTRRPRGWRRPATPVEIPGHAYDHPQRGPQLRLPDPVRRYIGVDGMHSEERGRRPCDMSIEDARGQPPERERDTHVEHEATRMHRPRRAVTNRPLEREAEHRDRAIVADTILWWPVGLAQEPPSVREIM